MYFISTFQINHAMGFSSIYLRHPGKSLWIRISVNKNRFWILRDSHQNNDEENVSTHSSLFFRLHTYFITKPSYYYAGVSYQKNIIIVHLRGSQIVTTIGIAPVLHGNGTSCLDLRQQWEEDLPLQQTVVVQLPAERTELESSSLQLLALTGMSHFHSSPATVYDSIKLTITQHSWKKQS